MSAIPPTCRQVDPFDTARSDVTICLRPCDQVTAATRPHRNRSAPPLDRTRKNVKIEARTMQKPYGIATSGKQQGLAGVELKETSPRQSMASWIT